MKNEFYTDFDFERLKPSKRATDYRSPFQIDRDRIIHSSEFRRLQGKTQVFLPGEYDFYRTRLTHSLEVSQIGRSICNYLLKKTDTPLTEDYFIDPDLVESACLAHDIGHPPFGHAGERTLNNLMKDYGGFEGNAQTLRLITELLYTNNKRRRGMNPSRAFLDSILKYKQSYSEFQKPENHFIYDYQKDYLNFNFDGKTNPDKNNEDLNSFRSIECQIMDWADDTAYAINDIVDSISIGFLSIGSLAKWGSDNESRFKPEQLNYLDEIMQWIKSGTFKSRFGSQIGDFILGCNLEERNTFMDDVTNRYKYILSIDEDINEKIKLYKCISIELVFNSPQLHQLEFKGNSMLSDIFSVLVNNYLENEGPVKLLPDLSHHLIEIETEGANKIRLICDYISGMTDSYAIKTYRRLFDPGFSSILELS